MRAMIFGAGGLLGQALVERLPGHGFTLVGPLGGRATCDIRDAAAVQEAMAAARPEVVNLSVGGYGTDQELIALEERGLRYGPDVVVLNFCLFSDFIERAFEARGDTALIDSVGHQHDGFASGNLRHSFQCKLDCIIKNRTVGNCWNMEL